MNQQFPNLCETKRLTFFKGVSKMPGGSEGIPSPGETKDKLPKKSQQELREKERGQHEIYLEGQKVLHNALMHFKNLPKKHRHKESMHKTVYDYVNNWFMNELTYDERRKLSDSTNTFLSDEFYDDENDTQYNVYIKVHSTTSIEVNVDTHEVLDDLY